MTRRIEADGNSIEEALVQALAELTDQRPDDVDVKIAVPGLDTAVPARLTLQVSTPDDDEDAAPEAPEADTQGEADEPAPAAPRREEARRSRPAAQEVDEDEEIDLDAEADAAADFLEGLLDRLELPGDLRIRITEEHAEVEIVDVGSGALIGRRGQTLEAIQELARCALQREFQRRSHVKIDIEGYRERRLEKLLEKAEEAIDSVLETGETERLEPMDVFERKAIHHLVAEYEGVVSRSQGREPARRVMIEPA